MNLDKEIFEIATNDIMPNRFQPREMFDDKALNELATSIKEHGVIQPIIVRKVGDKYEIIAGERRYRASKLAGKDTIPAIVKDMDDKEAAKVALLENLQRKDLTPIEEAKTYQTILKLDDMTQEELATNLGKSQSTIANKLRLLQLDDEVQTALLNEKISERHARSLLNIEDKEKQRELLNLVIMNRMTVKQLDDEISKITGKNPQSQEETPINDIQTVFENEQSDNITKPLNEAPVYQNFNEEKSNEMPQNHDQLKPIQNDQNQDQTKILKTDQPEQLNTNIFSNLRNTENDLNDENSQFKTLEPIIMPNTTANNTIEQETKLENSNHESNLTVSFDELNSLTSNESVENKEHTSNQIADKFVFSEVEKQTPIINEMPETNKLSTDAPYGNIYDLRFAINNVRQAVQNTEKFGFKIDVEEFDLSDMYQIVIKIDKTNKS